MVQFISLASLYLLWGLAKRKSFLSYDIMTTETVAAKFQTKSQTS